MNDTVSNPNNAAKPKPSERRRARQYALQALYQWHMAGASLTDIDAQFRTDYDMSKVDLGYFSELLHGIPRNLKVVQDGFEPFLDRNFDELDPIELTTLRIGTFELMFRLDVPYKVVINESIELAKRYGAEESHRYVNGILDKVAARARMEEMRALRGK
ncbi:transcription antitermination factor NusB [Zooshikella marina]|uniref:transcription antitermination factor NusB n=1 Tax=Zooshikella ganghwensis TaxID=202772 RepID=UPI001BAEA037|nr:transcription antitermination factor NusB [Zooshikella ganghwensis]MBU2707452.1 transcription antitermination factor NusB [Zooshikella ganghwensis]